MDESCSDWLTFFQNNWNIVYLIFWWVIINFPSVSLNRLTMCRMQREDIGNMLLRFFHWIGGSWKIVVIWLNQYQLVFQAQGGTWKDVSICIYVINYFLGKSPDYFRVFISILSVLSWSLVRRFVVQSASNFFENHFGTCFFSYWKLWEALKFW